MYRLHYSPDAASLVVNIVLRELGQPFDLVRIDRAGGGLDTPAYRALHPIGQIPVLETPDGPIFETAAILLWLADRHSALAPAPASPDRAAFLKWFVFTNNNIHTTQMQLFYPERAAGPDCAPRVIAHARARMETLLRAIDSMITTEKPAWLSPDQPSILGHYLGMLVRWMQFEGDDHPTYMPQSLYPALAAVVRAHQARPAVLAAAEAEGIHPLYVKPEGH